LHRGSTEACIGRCTKRIWTPPLILGTGQIRTATRDTPSGKRECVPVVCVCMDACQCVYTYACAMNRAADTSFRRSIGSRSTWTRLCSSSACVATSQTFSRCVVACTCVCVCVCLCVCVCVYVCVGLTTQSYTTTAKSLSVYYREMLAGRLQHELAAFSALKTMGLPLEAVIANPEKDLMRQFLIYDLQMVRSYCPPALVCVCVCVCYMRCPPV
jgi:hypothetical protein